jgi:hypothetical protein
MLSKQTFEALVLTSIVLALWIGQAQPANWPATKYVGIGAGVKTCAAYLNYYRDDPHLTNNMFTSWAQGFLSGSNVAEMVFHGSYRNVSALTPAQIDWYMHKYCVDNPLGTYANGMADLLGTLPVARVDSP